MQVYARQEVILSAGALDSPKLLLLSGIGPKEELEEHGIPVIQNLPGIGKNLHDHLWLELVTTQKMGSHHRTSYISSPDALQAARDQWIKDKTGPLSDYYLPQMISYLKSDRISSSKEFEELDNLVQKHLQAETTPNYELISVSNFLSGLLILTHLTTTNGTTVLVAGPAKTTVRDKCYLNRESTPLRVSFANLLRD